MLRINEIISLQKEMLEQIRRLREYKITSTRRIFQSCSITEETLEALCNNPLKPTVRITKWVVVI